MKTPMSNIFLEDLQPGMQFETARITVDKDEIIAFALQFDPQYFHTDPDRASTSEFGGLIASGFHTLALSFRLFFDLNLWENAIIASPGLNDIKWLKPMRPGDTIYMKIEVTDVRRSSSKLDRGVVLMQHDTYNQHSEKILALECAHVLRLRESSRSGHR